MDGISVATPLHVPVLWLSTAERISVIVEMNHPGVLVMGDLADDRSRKLLVRQRTMLSTAIRGHVAELGIISAKGRNGTAELLEIIANPDDDRIPAVARLNLAILARQYAAVTTEIGAIEKQIHAWHQSREESRRLEEIPGIGPIVATALVAEVGDWRAFSSDVASPPGLGWYPGSIRPAARRGSAEYQSRAIDICDGCWLQVP